jgi:hypothetical protein
MSATQNVGAQPLVFFQLNKIDEAQRLVHGRAVQEVPDRVGEIFDYETSVPFFKAWSASQFEASNGKSNGNVREMHKDVAAGIVIPGGLTFNDDEKAIDLTARIVDEGSWQKVLSGTFTGFSIGGRYAKKWEDLDLKKTRYTADPSEISLVDRPCIGTATFFEIQKADGTLEKRDFVKPADLATEFPTADDPAAAVVEKAFTPPKDGKKGDKATDKATGTEYEHDGTDWQKCEGKKVEPAAALDTPKEDEFDIEATPEQVDEFCKLLASSNITMAKLLDDMKTLGKVAARDDVNPKEGKQKYGSMKFADAANKKYPIDTEEHIRAAWNYINKAKNSGKYSTEDAATIKGHIVSAWKDKIDKDGPPSAAKVDDGDLGKAVLRKNLALCGEFSYLLHSLCALQERVEYEEELENDDTDLPARMMNCLVDLGNVLADMVKEEVVEQAEDKEANNEPGTPVMAMAEAVGELQKRASENLKKYGARNSKTDQGALQQAHDALCTAGAKCRKAYLFADDEPVAVAAAAGTVNVGDNDLKSVAASPNDKVDGGGDLAKMATENETLRKSISDLNALTEQLKKDMDIIKAQPLPNKVRLRAIGKGEDVGGEIVAKVEPVKDARGEESKAATLIKGIHQTGGEPLFPRLSK